MRISRATAYRLVGSGELPAVKVGGSIRVDRDALNSMLDTSSNRKEKEQLMGKITSPPPIVTPPGGQPAPIAVPPPKGPTPGTK